MNNTTWMLVADACQAKIYSTHKASLFSGNGKKLTLISQHEHEESRKKNVDLRSDRLGQFGSGTFVDATGAKRHEEELFAIELAKNLTKAHGENKYHELILIAPPVFMGLIKKHLSNEVNKLLSSTIEKDYTKLSDQELVIHLREFL